MRCRQIDVYADAAKVVIDISRTNVSSNAELDGCLAMGKGNHALPDWIAHPKLSLIHA